jgi:hypothetical protein
MGGRSVNFSKQTDANGRFELTGQAGDVLGFDSLKKDGYRLSPKALTALNYSRIPTPPSPDEPVVFKMWKIGTPERLVTWDKFYGLAPDGRTYTIDLIKGTKTEGESADGDLRVKIVRPARIQPREHFDWSFVIETINGGILPADDEFLYLAPAEGYQTPYRLEFTSSQTNWTGLVKQEFYVRSRGGAVYGRLDVEVIADYNDKSVFSVKSVVNPSGSRNLE